jgi:hypothetical protein
MPTLTRRRSENSHQETWHIFFDDVHVGAIGKRTGVPGHTDQWGWSCGSIPGSSLDSKRADRPRLSNWHVRPSNGHGASCCRTSRPVPSMPIAPTESIAPIAAIHARGERLPSEVPSSLMLCPCGVTFDSHKPAESYEHRRHI